MDIIYFFAALVCIIFIFIILIKILMFFRAFYFNGYTIKIFKGKQITNKIILQMKQISLNCVNIIPNNPIFNYKNKKNKILLMVYKNTKPIGFNLMFDYEFKNYKCLHIGLTLIDKKYQGRGIKNVTVLNIIFYLVENWYKDIYITNLGRSSTSFKLFNQILDNSYPNYIQKTKNNEIYKSIFVYFLDNFKEDTQIYKYATYNLEKFIIYDGNNGDGGSEYIIKNENKSCTMTRNKEYNEIFYEQLGPYDDLLAIGKINIFTIFIYLKKYLVNFT